MTGCATVAPVVLAAARRAGVTVTVLPGGWLVVDVADRGDQRAVALALAVVRFSTEIVALLDAETILADHLTELTMPTHRTTTHPTPAKRKSRP